MDRSLLNECELREFASDCERLDVCGPEGGVFEAEWVRKALERRQVRTGGSLFRSRGRTRA